MRIHKQTLHKLHKQTLMLHAGAKFLTAQEQHGVIALWYQVEPDAPLEPRTIVCYFTGVDVEPGSTYLATVQLHHGGTVVHVFEEPQP
jgi:hypothetical protein